ncbi:MAG: hypothetical protein V1793_10380 [Pseudomonadota bacterium]
MVANRNASHSVQIADFYMTLRQIPRSNLLVLCSRSDYGKSIATLMEAALWGSSDLWDIQKVEPVAELYE